MTGAAVLTDPGRVPITFPMASTATSRPSVAHPHGDQVPALPVGVGQRQARAAAAFEGADLAEFLKPAYEPVSVDSEGCRLGHRAHNSTMTRGGGGCQ